MRNISFALTMPQFLGGSKTVTRRLGWTQLEYGDKLCAVKKSQGLKAGAKVERLGIIRVVDVRREQLQCMFDMPNPHEELRCEGFPDFSVADFIAFFCRTHKCTPETLVTRIEFVRLPSSDGGGA